MGQSFQALRRIFAGKMPLDLQDRVVWKIIGGGDRWQTGCPTLFDAQNRPLFAYFGHIRQRGSSELFSVWWSEPNKCSHRSTSENFFGFWWKQELSVYGNVERVFCVADRTGVGTSHSVAIILHSNFAHHNGRGELPCHRYHCFKVLTFGPKCFFNQYSAVFLGVFFCGRRVLAKICCSGKMVELKCVNFLINYLFLYRFHRMKLGDVILLFCAGRNDGSMIFQAAP